jgi:hypothetical protein
MNPNTTAVFSFPIKAPDGAVTRDDVSALSQLELSLAYQRHWCEHKPSITVTVREDEWMDVGAWVYQHFDEVSGECGVCWGAPAACFCLAEDMCHAIDRRQDLCQGWGF